MLPLATAVPRALRHKVPSVPERRNRYRRVRKTRPSEALLVMADTLCWTERLLPYGNVTVAAVRQEVVAPAPRFRLTPATAPLSLRPRAAAGASHRRSDQPMPQPDVVLWRTPG